MTSADEIRIFITELTQALHDNLPPPPIPPDLPAEAQSEIDALLTVLGMAGNAGDPADMADALAGQAQRDMRVGEALTRFPATEEQSAQSLQQVMGMAQQLPQTLSGLGQGLGQGPGGFMQQLNQLLQQGAQAGQQLAGLGQSAQAAELPADALGEALGAGESLLGAGGGLSGAGGLAGTSPASNLGPPATPAASTFPSAASSVPPPPTSPDSAGLGRGAMGGYPMMPPGAAGGASGPTDAKADTKRVVSPPVRNGAPVQGRVGTPPRLPEVEKRIDGKPVAHRRLLAPGRQADSDTDRDR